ncbi:MAG TPA: hypothetical protein VMU28_06290, partial [Terriglobales bacterium]|nr:hypothetical protein [Terriglobales bacterium]
MRTRYAKWMYDWETRLTTRDTNRIVRPFEWGLDWTDSFCLNGSSPKPGPNLEDYFHRLNDHIVAHS